MPNWMALKNMQMFAEEVMPLFREEDGKPDYLREGQKIGGTNAERAAHWESQKIRPPRPSRVWTRSPISGPYTCRR